MSIICFVCQEEIVGLATRQLITEPNGLQGVSSEVTLCSEHADVHPSFLRKRLEDYYTTSHEYVDR